MCKILNKNINEKNLKYYFTKYPQWGKLNKVSPEPLSLPPPSNEKSDNVILRYIKSNPKIIIITIWSKYDENYLREYLNNIGSIYYEKKIELSKNAMTGLLYQLDAESDKYKKFTDIVKKVDEIYQNEEKKWINIIVFDNIKDEFIELIRLSINEMLEFRNNLAISDGFNQTIEQAQIYFCGNSIKFLEEQLLEKFMHPVMRKSRIMLATFRNWYYQNTTLEEREKIILFSSAILYVYGIRNMNDIDLIIENDGENISDNFRKYLIDDQTKFCFIDSKIRNTETWPRHWKIWEPKWLGEIGAKNFGDVLENQKYHYYFLGLKFLCLEGDIVRRVARERPRSIVDLIKIKENLANYRNISIPSIPDYGKKYIQLDFDEKFEKFGKGNENVRYLKETHEVEYYEKIDREKFLKTMQWYLKKMYGEELEISAIKEKMRFKKNVKLRIKVKKNEEVSKKIRIKIKK